ncbi:MAG: lipase maturation factor family protein [Acidobacteria bacterium]|nr:lipase maturation factor family protein [Acidobacteriota bacterium]
MPGSPKESAQELEETAAAEGRVLQKIGRVGPGRAERSSYWLTRFLILRLLGLVYLVAFLVAAQQAVPLLGENGLLPADRYLERVAAGAGGQWDGFLRLPGLFWLHFSDAFMAGTAWVGVGLSLAVLLGFANGILLLILWFLYMSFDHVGQTWYGFGWEIQLLETGLLAVFLVPFLDGRPFPRRPPPVAVLWMYRWLIFRIMVGAGLIKIRGDACWRNLTCLDYHYETQPIPNPLSRAFHFLPRWCQRGGVLFNHLVELGAPWLEFGPRIARHAAGVLFVAFQATLILSGNLSYLNRLTIIPAGACVVDRLLRRVLARRLAERAVRAARVARPCRALGAAVGVLAVVVGALSLYPVRNLLSQRQMMNTSFDRLHLVNTYGAFGSVGEERPEIVFEGTADETITEATEWRAYEFKCKPGDPMRRPCWISPYHYRLDWLIWFAAMSNPNQYPWTVHLVWKLLRNDPGTLGLLANDPFPDAPPRFIRAQLYRYEFAPPGNPEGAWWKRALLGPWLPPLSRDDPRLIRFLEAHRWDTSRDGPAPPAP